MLEKRLDKLWLITGNYQRSGARRVIDARLRNSAVRGLTDRPEHGWIREIRDALGMTTRQLAARMDLSQPAVVQLEQSEVADRVQLDSLRKAAAALDCDLAYALIPRTTLEKTVHARAVELATRDLAADAGGDAEVLARRIDHIAARLVADGRLWDDRDAQ